ncbi:MAG: U32 family peptidase [Candidatus Firestonebacteria bacterium]|nr:U32 family peptidase [Candidatus Firestonebacteria bacterium]
MYNPLLIAPAGNYEKLKIALQFGADAVYLGDARYSLRACSDNFSREELREAVNYVHNFGKKVFVTVNIFARNNEFDNIKNYISYLIDLKIDGIVVSDPGIFETIKEIDPSVNIHISTQANVFNYKTVKFWEKLKAKRIILARELTFQEIKRIRESTSLELEIFIHGAMCMAYSGRCFLSNYMTGRDANIGMCAHPCRYRFNLVEEKRPGQYFPVDEDQRGSYILSSKDLCTIEHIHKFMQIGINGFKIEGRMKGIYYLAVVTKTYRKAIDNYIKNPDNYIYNTEWKEELLNISHREYTGGFYFEKDNIGMQTGTSYIQKYDIVGIIKEINENGYLVEIRGKLEENDNIEILTPYEDLQSQKIEIIKDKERNTISIAQPNQLVYIELKGDLQEGYILRRKKV